MIKDNEKIGFWGFVWDFLKGRFPGDSKKYKTYVVVLVVIIIIIAGCGLWLLVNFFSDSIKINSYNKTANVSGSVLGFIQGDNNDVKIFLPEAQASKISFNEEKWVDTLGNLAALRKNKNQLFLPRGERSGLIKYSEIIPVDSRFELRFRPLGEAINFVISIPTVYEIIIGDGDYETITLKKTDGDGSSPSILVPVIGTKDSPDTRPTFNYRIKKGEEVAVNVDQKMFPNGDLWIQLDVHYWSEGSNEKLLQSFQFQFKPSPQIQDSLFLNIGLIRDTTKYQDISVELISPVLAE